MPILLDFLGGLAVANGIQDVAILQEMTSFLEFFAPAALLDILGAHFDPSHPTTPPPPGPPPLTEIIILYSADTTVLLPVVN